MKNDAGPQNCVTVEVKRKTMKQGWHFTKAHFSLFAARGRPAACVQKLKVLFAVGSDGEVSEPLEVNALSCDTVEQVKEKILATFNAKFGFPYGPPLRELCIGKDPAGFS